MVGGTNFGETCLPTPPKNYAEHFQYSTKLAHKTNDENNKNNNNNDPPNHPQNHQ